MATSRICSIPDCDKPVHGHGWCSAHYERWRSHGDPLAGRTPNGEPHRFLREVVLSYEGDECLIWPYWKSSGYATIWIDGGNAVVSRVVCEIVHGAPPTPKHEAAHECGRGRLGCVSPNHLSWKTPSANQMDRVRHGTSTRGQRSNFVKITEPMVREIRALSGTMGQAVIAARIGVTPSHVSRIIRRERWGWLD